MAELEVMQDSSPIIQDPMEMGDIDMESLIQRAMRFRFRHFKEQADSLTFEGVRRLLEKDLGLDTYALDAHKRFIKGCLFHGCLNGGDDDNGFKNLAEIVEENVSTNKGAVVESLEKEKMKKDLKESGSEEEEKMDDSPVMGLLTGIRKSELRNKETQDIEKIEIPSESKIREAIRKRASYLEANSDEITMAGVRQLLEEDLELDKNTLDPFKKFINDQVAEALKSPKVYKPASGVKKRTSEKNSRSKASKKIISEGSSDSESKEIEDEVRSHKKVAPKRKIQKSEEPRKHKRSAKETKMSSKKRGKLAESSEANSDAETSGNAPEDGQSQPSAEKLVKMKEVATPAYGKHVEHLKSIIKSCGMSVPPAIYKRAKQVPENKREAFLKKELEEMLSREGLSTDPSEKEIKEVKKRKDKAKELEGIDMSNVVSSTRRRSTTSFVAPLKPEIPVESGGNDAEDIDSSNSDVDTDDNNDDNDAEE